MLKELLSDFKKTLNPSYQSDTFQPYFSVILSIMTVTILAYGFQTTTNAIYTYSTNPGAFRNSILQLKSCTDLTKTALLYICTGVQGDSGTYKLPSLLSFEQDLHNKIN